MLVEHTLASLRQKLEKATLKQAEAQKALKAAERKEERASDVVRDLHEQIAAERLRLWGNEPNLSALMDSSRDSTMTFYYALQAIAESRGFGIGGKWADTDQTVLRLAMNRSEFGAVERVIDAIDYFAQGMKRIRGGWVRFSVASRDSESCAWELRYSPKRGNAQLVRMVYASEDETLKFDTLREAIQHVENHLWCEDVIDAEPSMVLERLT